MGSSSMFPVICILHSLISLTYGSLIMFYLKEIFVFGHGVETTRKLSGSTPHDQLLIQTSNSFVGLLPFFIGFFLFMVSFANEEFQSLLPKAVFFFTFRWHFGGSTSRVGSRIWLGIGLNSLLGIWY